MIIIIVSIIDSSKSALTIFLKLMFTIDIRKSVTGQDFSKKMIFIRTMGENPHFLMFLPISLTIFLKLYMIFTIDIRKKSRGWI